MPTLFRTLPAVALAGALGICLMGEANDPVSQADVTFAPTAMKVILQSVADAEAVQGGSDAALATSIQTDGLALGNQLASLSSYYGINVPTDLPKAQSGASFASNEVAELTNLLAVLNAEKSGGNASQMRTFADSAIAQVQKDLDAAKAASK
jgi:hypothetical protein